MVIRVKVEDLEVRIPLLMTLDGALLLATA